MDDVYSKLYQTGDESAKRTPTNRRANRSVPELKELLDQLNATPVLEDKRTAVLFAQLMGSMHRVIDVEELIEKASDKSKMDGVSAVNLLRFANLVTVEVELPNELGLTSHFLVQAPLLASVQGNIKMDTTNWSMEWNGVARMAMKLTSQIRTHFPWSTSYIAGGVDVRLDLHAPRTINVELTKQKQLVIATKLGEKINDLAHYHVMPYTTSRDWSTTPVMEDETNTKVVRISASPFQRKMLLPGSLNNFQVIVDSDYPLNDMNAWTTYLAQFDSLSVASQMLVPMSMHYREYRAQYSPESGPTNAITAMFHYFGFWKSGTKSLTYASGTSDANDKTVESSQDVPDYAVDIVDRLFKSVDSGEAFVLRSALQLQHKDGAKVHMNASYGYSYDYITSKSYRDVQLMRVGSGDSYAVCGSSSVTRSLPPAFGFSSEPLYQTEDGIFQAGASCKSPSADKMTYKIKMMRDETAANVARESDAAEKCRLQSKSGLVDSPSCQEARNLDQTFNMYAIEADVPDQMSTYAAPIHLLVTKYFAPFIVSRSVTPPQNNKWLLKAMRQPVTGKLDVILRSPTTATYARNVHFSNATYTPAVATIAPALFPIRADTSYVDSIKSSLTAGVSDRRCFVGAQRVITFDGVHYNHTLGDCTHVLVTDCQQKSRFAITARESESRKIVKVITDKDSVEIDPKGTVTINGVAKALDKDARFDIVDGQRVIASVSAMGNAIKMELKNIGLEVLVGTTQVSISGPWMVRGRTCGMCGDFNQETFHEHKTPQRCPVSSGALMATSFKVQPN